MIIGVFDSGIGGKAIANSLKKDFPQAEIIIVNDHKNVPYGDKTPAEIRHLTDMAIQPLLKSGCDVIVIACNTATAIAIDTLRHKYPTQKFVGIEPMIKTAASLTQSKIIAVCATPATLSSEHYDQLVKRYGHGLTIINPDCSDWAWMIENSQINQQKITQTINSLCKERADVIVLGCTHYIWIKDLITKISRDRASVIEPSEAIGKRVKNLLKLS